MTAYRHATEAYYPGACGDWAPGSPKWADHETGWAAGNACGCTTPTPDPASPCGRCRGGEDNERHEPGRPWTHPHVPTRCARCGHEIEPLDPGATVMPSGVGGTQTPPSPDEPSQEQKR